MMLMMMMMMMMMNDVHVDIPLLANYKKMQLFHDSGAEQRKGCNSMKPLTSIEADWSRLKPIEMIKMIKMIVES